MAEGWMRALNVGHRLIVHWGLHKLRDVFSESIHTWDHISSSSRLKLRSELIKLRPGQLFLGSWHASIRFSLHLHLWLLIVDTEVRLDVLGNGLLQNELWNRLMLFIDATGLDHVEGI